MSLRYPNQNEMKVPSLFQIAACFEDFFPAAGSNQRALAVSRTPFANLMSHPEQLMAVLRCTNHPNHTATPRNNKLNPAGRAARRATSRKPGSTPGKTEQSPAARTPKSQIFAGSAGGQFGQTRRGFYALGKVPGRDDAFPGRHLVHRRPAGAGKLFLPFPRGRGMAGGPRCIRRVPNPFGTANAVRVVE